MKWAGATAVALILAGMWLLLDQTRRTEENPDRGPAGIVFVVPDDYTVLELGESTPEAAATQLLQALRGSDTVAAVFTRAGNHIQLLVDESTDTIDERVTGQQGTLQRALWRGPVRERLEWAEQHGDFAAPGMPPPERRNAYH